MMNILLLKPNLGVKAVLLRRKNRKSIPQTIEMPGMSKSYHVPDDVLVSQLKAHVLWQMEQTSEIN